MPKAEHMADLMGDRRTNEVVVPAYGEQGIDPKWDPYRDDPRLRSLRARCAFTS